MKKPRTYKLGLMTRRSLNGWLFILPFLLGFIFFVLSPIYTALVLSFNEQVFDGVTGITNIQSVGFQAYETVLRTQPHFLQKLAESAVNMVLQVPCILIFSFLMANVLNQEFRGRTFARAILFMPVITSAGVAATLLGADSGVDQSQMAALGAQSMNVAGNIKASVGGTFGNIISGAFDQLTVILNASGVPILIFLAGLQTISPSIFESSKVEGATAWENFWKITFPMISPMILVNTVYTLIEVLCSMNNPMLNYLYSIKNDAPVEIMAMSWMYFLITAIVISVVALIISKLVYYEN